MEHFCISLIKSKSMATKGAKKSTENKSTPKKEVKKSSAEIKHKEKIEELSRLVEQEKEKFIRLFAEFENFKKRWSYLGDRKLSQYF